MFWVTIASGMLLLLVAAVSKKNEELCKEVTVDINSVDENKFIDEKDIKYLIKAFTKTDLKGEPVSAFDLNALESMLEKNVWIKDAELYFDNLNGLNIHIKVRSPLARIITTDNGSFYMDETEKIMPLSDKVSARVPVFTGFPEKKNWSRADSNLISAIKTIALSISKDPFWVAQVSQIDIIDSKTFELIPVIGDHIVNLGAANNIDKKLKKLFIFYKEVLAKSGFDKYGRIDLQYEGQVIGKPKGASPMIVDSMKYQLTVASLMEIEIEKKDSVINNTNPEKPIIKSDIVEKKPINKSLSDVPKTGPDPVKTTQSVFNKEELNKENKTPKAVLKKKENF